MAAKKGALSMLPLDPNDPATEEYTTQMRDLMGSLALSPEEDAKDNLTAWGAGLSSPGGQSGAMSRAATAELAQRNKSKELRAMYVPQVMSALTAQMQARQQQQLLSSLGNIDFSTMTPEQVAQLETATGKSYRELWEIKQFGKNASPGSTNTLPNQGGATIASDTKAGNQFAVGPGGKVTATPISGVAENEAFGAALGEYGKGVGALPFKELPTNVGGQPGTIPAAQRFGMTSGAPTREQFGGPAAGVGTPPGAAPGAPPVVAPPGGAPSAPSGPNLLPTDGVTVPGAGGRPTVPGAVQGQRDAGAVGALVAERQKALGLRSAAMAAFQQAQAEGKPDIARAALEEVNRQEQDLLGLSREIQTMSRGAAPAAARPGAVPATPTPAAPAGAPPGFNPTGMAPSQEQALKLNEKSNTDWIEKSYRPTLEAGDSSRKALTSIGTMRTGLAAIGPDGTGWGDKYKQGGAELLAALGHKNAEKAATGYQTFQAGMKGQVMEILGNQKGPQTDQDATRADAMIAGLGKTTQSNQFLMDLAQATAEREMKKASFYMRAKEKLDPTGTVHTIDKEWSEIAPSVFDAPVMRRWNVPKGK